jgi:hypothetical protein
MSVAMLRSSAPPTMNVIPDHQANPTSTASSQPVPIDSIAEASR